MSVIPGTENRGGAVGQAQKTTFAAVVASTSADRSCPNAAGLRKYNQISTSGVMMKWKARSNTPLPLLAAGEPRRGG
jgi:hypothetical protein